jgi:hypothetical protein
MAVVVTHSFNCSIPDDGAALAAGEVTPSKWNAQHTVTGLGYFATGTDAANLTGTVPALSIAGSYPGITGVGALSVGSLAAGFTPLANSLLQNSSLTLGSTSVSLGATAATIAGLTLTAPVLGVATGTSLALGGATIGSNALAVNGAVRVTNASITIDTNQALFFGVSGTEFSSPGTSSFSFTNAAQTASVIFSAASGNAAQLGLADAAVAVAQTLRVQSVVAGTSAANGANWTLIGSLPTGTGTSGDIIFRTGVNTGSGTTQGTPTTALTIKGETQNVNLSSNLVANAGIATGVSGVGFFSWQGPGSVIRSPSAGVITLNDAAADFGRLQFGGTTSSFPAIARSGAVLIVELADASANAPIIASIFSAQAGGYTANFVPASGGATLLDGSNINFGRLQFGGTTSSFPAIKRNAGALDIRLADDSAYATINAQTVGTIGAVNTFAGTTIPAGGTAGSGVTFSATANFGTFFGSGAPTLSAAQGSLYLRSDGSSTSTRLYVNTDGSTGWTNVTTGA